MKFLTALIQHSRQPSRGVDRPPVALQAPPQPDLGSRDLLAAEEPAPMADVTPGQPDSAPQAVDRGDGDQRSLAPDPGDEREPEADLLAAVPAPSPEPSLSGASPEASAPPPAAGMLATQQSRPQAPIAAAAEERPAPPPIPASPPFAATPAVVESPAEPQPDSPSSAGSRARAAHSPAVASTLAAGRRLSPAAQAPTDDTEPSAPAPDPARSAPAAAGAPAPLKTSPGEEMVPQRFTPLSERRERVPARAAASPSQRPAPGSRDWSPQPQPPELPQVRIGQINVLVEDQAAAKPRTRSSQPAPGRTNPFGRRGL